jgi:lipopolysaccharide biosynthesis glycosyltransferase
MKHKANAIVVCCTANWLPYAACTIKSCMDQGGAIADLYVICMGLTDQHRQDFAAFLTRHNFSANLIDGVLPEKLVKNAQKRFSAAAFLRLTLNEILAADYQRVLYLDSDILALAPIAPLFEMDIGGKPLAAVEDYQSFPGRFGAKHNHASAIGLPPGARYFNSGVLLFDWPQTLARKLLQECVQRILALDKSAKKLGFPDQDVMNLVFAGEWLRLPRIYNLISIVSDYFPERPVFRHFTMDNKPWHAVWVLGYGEYRAQYKAMLAGTPWSSLIGERLTNIAPIQSLNMLRRRLSKRTRARYLHHLES